MGGYDAVFDHHIGSHRTASDNNHLMQLSIDHLGDIVTELRHTMRYLVVKNDELELEIAKLYEEIEELRMKLE